MSESIVSYSMHYVLNLDVVVCIVLLFLLLFACVI